MTIPTRWTSGPHHGLAWPGGVVMLDGTLPLPVATMVWEGLEARAAAGVDALCRLLDDLAPGVAAAVAVATRGGVVEAAVHDGRSWDRSDLGDVSWVRVALGEVSGEQGAPTGALDPALGWRPLGAGVVPAAALIWQVPVSRVAEPLPEGLITQVPKRPAAAAASPPAPEVAPAAAPAEAPGEAADEAPDHDGLTAAHTRRRTSPGGAQIRRPDPGQVLALVCPRGHVNPPSRALCRVCALTLADPAQRVPRPPLGVIRSSAGDLVELTAPVVVGRNPRPQPGSVEEPLLLPIPVPHISGSHVELRVEGWTVLAVDLESTNGTFLRRRGEPTMRLSATPTPLLDGDVVDLGHGVQLTVEGLA